MAKCKRLMEAMEEHGLFELPVIYKMVRAIEGQKISNNPKIRYILEGFTDQELNTIILFLKSFDDETFNRPIQ